MIKQTVVYILMYLAWCVSCLGAALGLFYIQMEVDVKKYLEKFLRGCGIAISIVVAVLAFVLGVYLIGMTCSGNWEGVLSVIVYFVVMCGLLALLS